MKWRCETSIDLPIDPLLLGAIPLSRVVEICVRHGNNWSVVDLALGSCRCKAIGLGAVGFVVQGHTDLCVDALRGFPSSCGYF